MDVNALCNPDVNLVRAEVERCIEQGAPGGGYMLSSSNSLFGGMNMASIREMYRYAGEIGLYENLSSSAGPKRESPDVSR